MSSSGSTLTAIEVAGRPLYKTRTPYVRFTHFHPVRDKQAFFFNVLLQHIPFSNLGQLQSFENPTGCYFYECYLRHILPDEDHLSALLVAYAESQLLDASASAQLMQQLLHEGNFGQAPSEAPDSREAADVAMQILQEGLQQTFACAAGALTPCQQAVVSAVDRQPRGLYVINGPAGTGKTHVVQVRVLFLSQPPLLPQVSHSFHRVCFRPLCRHLTCAISMCRC